MYVANQPAPLNVIGLHMLWTRTSGWGQDCIRGGARTTYYTSDVDFLAAKDKSEKTFAFTFLKIMRDDGSIIPDGPHELFVYKVGVVNVPKALGVCMQTCDLSLFHLSPAPQSCDPHMPVM